MKPSNLIRDPDMANFHRNASKIDMSFSSQTHSIVKVGDERVHLLLIRVVELLLGNSLHSLGELGVCSGVRGARGDREHRLVRFPRPVILCFRRVGGEPRSVELVVVAENRKGNRVAKVVARTHSTPSSLFLVGIN